MTPRRGYVSRTQGRSLGAGDLVIRLSILGRDSVVKGRMFAASVLFVCYFRIEWTIASILFDGTVVRLCSITNN